MTMMLMTETLYAFRKRVRWFQVGRLRGWLSFHIFTGIVGPALVLLHSAIEYNGLAGLSILLTLIVVGSGFVGRYMYTAIPRTRAGTEATLDQVAAQVAEVQSEIERFAAARPAQAQSLMAADATHRAEAQQGTARTLLVRALVDWRYRRALSRQLRQLDQTERRQLAEVSRLLRRRRELERQIATLHSAHRLMSAWHTVHVPLGVTLFMSAFLHVIGTLYYGATKLF
jgi:prefoldin subunit 5